ncbi:cingulin [Eublepharis macularius]|uniref:Cingulin n=1 Tax=Eublepharis macularius TaxID=481883 RepID=A0AA97KB19_EUBMA|nr:cingulin [Eublepharis macularius]XP_054853748.1 cingulin [Eublepharis macularius]XP_054853757.1 cingulin [Eublepharis macularius]
MDHQMNGVMAEKHSPIDYGVQIRFIDDLKEPGKSQKIRPKISKPGSYGVAVRVQGIDGQPFVVLNSGEKGGDSFGVQIKGESKYGAPARNQQPEEQFPGSPGTASSSKDASGSISSDSDLPENPYAAKMSRYGSQYSTSDEEQGPRRCTRVPKPDSLETASSYHSNGSSLPRGSYRTLPHKKAFGEQLRRTQSHGSLLSPDLEEPREPSPPRTQPVHASQQAPAGGTMKSSSMMNLASRKLPSPRDEVGSVSGLRPVKKQPLLEVEESSQSAQPANTGGGSDIDTKPLSSVDSLINKFDGKALQRGRASRRSRVLPEDRKRSQSLDGRVPYHDTADSRELDGSGPQASFGDGPATSTAKQLGSGNLMGTRNHSRVPGQQPKENGVDKSKLTREWVVKNLEEPVTDKQPNKVQSDMQLKSTPDLLKDQQKVLQPGSSEHTKALIYGILKDGSTESESSMKKKTNLVFEKIQTLAAVPSADSRSSPAELSELQRKFGELQRKLDEETKLRQRLELSRDSRRNGAPRNLEIRLEESEEECRRLREAFEKKTQELQSGLQELKEAKTVKDQTEAKLADMEEQLMEMQEELDRFRELSGDTPSREALLRELLETREELEEVMRAKQKQEEQLRQRERELTALKGALKEEVSNHDKELDRVRQQCQQDVELLRRNMEDVSQDQASLEAERQKINSVVRNLQRELEESNEEATHWKEMFQRNKEDLRSTKQELLQVKVEREEFEEELKEMRERFSAMRQEADQARNGAGDTSEADKLRKELHEAREQLRELVSEKQAQDELLRQRERELAALKGALQEEVASHDQEVEEVKRQFQENLQRLRKDYEDASKVKAALQGEKETTEQTKKAVESTLRETQEENDDLRRKILGLETQLKEYRHFADNWQSTEARLKEKVAKLEAERRQMEESLGDATDQEQELLLAKRSLESRLEEAHRSLNRLSREHQDLTASYQEETKQKEQLKKAKSELEEEKRLLDKSLGKLTRELDQMTEESHRALSELQAQLEEYKEKSRKEITDSQKQAKDRNAEVEKMQYNLGRLQDEVVRLKQALQDSQAERENAVLDKELLAQRLHNLEQEMDSKRRSQDDRSRQVKALEDKSKRLEVELDEERSTVELLTERINRTRDQIDQLRAELLQERSVRQDLECDKISLERQNKDLKSRLASSEGLQKPNANVSQLESRIQELQDKLQAEEREKSILLSSSRKLERKVKELTIQIDDERQHVNDQKDQLSLRVKALKRQVDGAEEEIERLEAARKKAQRELEEEHELNEQLQSRIKALEKDLWRKAARSTAESSLKDDQLSSDEEFDSAYGPSSIASLLTEGNLQTSSC